MRNAKLLLLSTFLPAFLPNVLHFFYPCFICIMSLYLILYLVFMFHTQDMARFRLVFFFPICLCVTVYWKIGQFYPCSLLPKSYRPLSVCSRHKLKICFPLGRHLLYNTKVLAKNEIPIKDYWNSVYKVIKSQKRFQAKI